MARFKRRSYGRRRSVGRARGFRRSIKKNTRFRRRAKRTYVTVSRGGIRL